MLLRVKGSSLADETFECLIEFLRIMRTSQRSVRLLALSRTSLSERCGRSLLTWLKTVREESASADEPKKSVVADDKKSADEKLLEEMIADEEAAKG